MRINAMISTAILSVSRTQFNPDTFRHPVLTDAEHDHGTRLGIDTWADTACAGKHAFVEEFLIGKFVTASGFTSALGLLEDLPVANVLYAYDMSNGETLLLESNNAIYLGNKMDDSLLNPIQAEEEGVRVDTRPRRYYHDDPSAQYVHFPCGTKLPVLYDGVLPYLPIRRPTKEEVQHCKRLLLSSKDPWDPFKLDGSFSRVDTLREGFDIETLVDEVTKIDPVSAELMSDHLYENVVMNSILQEQAGNDDNNYCTILAMKTSKGADFITPEELSSKLHIGLKTASRTLKATTSHFIRTTGALTKRFRTDKAQLRYKQLAKVFGSFYCDYLKCKTKSIRGYVGGVVYTNKLGFYKFVPCENETGDTTGRTLRHFIEIVGLPYSLHSDNHNNFKEGLFKKLLRKFGIFQTFTEPHSPWQNRAEPAIGEIKRYARKVMQKTNTPIRLWCFCYEYSADLLSLLANGRFNLQGRTPYEAVMHYTPDISEYVSFEWFQWCWYFDEDFRSKRLCRWLGPAHQVGQSFCSYLILENGEYIARSSVIPIPDSDLMSEEMKERMSSFTKGLESQIGNARLPLFDPTKPTSIYFSSFDDDTEDDQYDLPYGDELIDMKESEVNDAYLDSLDEYIGAEVVIPGRDAHPVLAKVKKRKRDAHGNPIGESNNNPILDSRVYELEFPDGRVEEYAVNVLAENLLNQADEDGWDTGLIDEIVDIRVDPNVAVPKSEGRIETTSGQLRDVVTTKGWDIQVRWKDQSTSWLPLMTVKESNPIELAEYFVANGLESEPAFKW